MAIALRIIFYCLAVKNDSQNIDIVDIRTTPFVRLEEIILCFLREKDDMGVL